MPQASPPSHAPWRALALLLVLPASAPARADSPATLSPRDRLYDVAHTDEGFFVVGHPGHLLYASDLARGFRSVAAHLPAEALFSIDFNARGQGAVVGRAGTLLSRSRSGAAWRASTIELEGERPDLFAVAVLPTGELVAVGEFGWIVRSEDAGRTFQRVDYTLAPAGERAAPSACPDLDRTLDDSPAVLLEARLTDVAFVDDLRGVVVGEFGLVLATTDGGRTFHQQETCTARTLYGLSVGGGSTWLAVGFDGTLLESVDEGRSWRSRPTPTDEDLYAAARFGSRHLIVGAHGTLLQRSATGDLEPLPSGVHTWLVSAALDDRGRGVVVGGRASLLQTPDGGRTHRAVRGTAR